MNQIRSRSSAQSRIRSASAPTSPAPRFIGTKQLMAELCPQPRGRPLEVVVGHRRRRVAGPGAHRPSAPARSAQASRATSHRRVVGRGTSALAATRPVAVSVHGLNRSVAPPLRGTSRRGRFVGSGHREVDRRDATRAWASSSPGDTGPHEDRTPTGRHLLVCWS